MVRAMYWNEIVGNTLIVLGVAMMLIGVVGVLRFRGFTMKVLSAAKIDTVAFLLLGFGVIFRSGIGWFSVKTLLLLFIVIALLTITQQIRQMLRAFRL